MMLPTDSNTIEKLTMLEKQKMLQLFIIKNKRLPATRNTGTKASKGTYILFLRC
ncbi:hypothetical protein KHA80_18380 [Anaerobacillus sp. HL2]|nr:hypothetical protein KHA80_18380 [Anaerobacillus sp. HL2]